MPLPSKSDPKCKSKTISIEKAHGKTQRQAGAIASSHCGGSRDTKNESTEQKIDKLLKSLYKDIDDIYDATGFLSSVKEVITKAKFSDRFQKLKDKVEKDLDKIDTVELEKLKTCVCNELKEWKE